MTENDWEWGLPPDDRGFFQRVIQSLMKHGWHVIWVDEGETSQSFSYSTGFSALKQPEVLILGLPPHLAHAIMKTIYDRIKEEGWEIPLDEDVPEILGGDYPVRFRRAAINSDAYPMSVTQQLMGKFDAVQMLWPDRECRFPTDDGYDHEIARQDLVDTP